MQKEVNIMVDLETKAHEITMEYLHQNPVTGINGQKASPEAFARAYQTYFHRILAVMRSQH
jgi:hypothetical protein